MDRRALVATSVPVRQPLWSRPLRIAPPWSDVQAGFQVIWRNLALFHG